jgi:hypothetical protein
LLRRVRLRSFARVRPVKPVRLAAPRLPAHRPATRTPSRSRTTRTTRAPSPQLRRVEPGHSPIAPSSRGVPLPVRSSVRDLAGRCRLPSFTAPAALLGFRSLRRFHPAAGWTRLRERGGFPKLPRRRFTAALQASRCSAFLPVRAHVPFVPLGPPRLIFVGVTDRLLEKRETCKSDRPGMSWRRLLGFNSRLRSARRRQYGRSNDPALGFASCRVGGHCCRASVGLDPESDHQPPERRRALFRPRRSYPLVGLPTRRLITLPPSRAGRCPRRAES